MNITVTISYNNNKVLRESIENYYNFCYSKPDYHIILNNHYPLFKDELEKEFKSISEDFGCLIFDYGKNIGVKNGMYFIANELNKIQEIKEDDKILFYDSNSCPITKNFDKALFDILDDDSVGMASLLNNEDKQEYKTEFILGYNTTNEANSISSINSMKYKQRKILENSFYVFSESYMDLTNHPISKQELNKNSLKMIHLVDFKEKIGSSTKEDFEYLRYKKLASSFIGSKFSFEDFLFNKTSFGSINNSLNKNIFYFSGEAFSK